MTLSLWFRQHEHDTHFFERDLLDCVDVAGRVTYHQKRVFKYRRLLPVRERAERAVFP
jgi:hypothetical protein